jgi:hypothetical protein
MSLKSTLFLLSGLLLLLPFKSIYASGYKTLISYQDGFLAAGSDGRIDWISASGIITKSEKFPYEEFNCLLAFNEEIIIAGNSGTLLISSDKGTFRKVGSGTKMNIHTLVFFKEMILAGSDQGVILIADKNGLFREKQLALKGDIVSLSATKADCYGVTDQGEIIHSTDGVNWTIFDFNESYAGYYKSCHFTRVLITENRIAVAGKHDDGTPALLFSTQGNVWTERVLNYTDEKGIASSLEDIPYDLFYDSSEDQFILCCSKGTLITIPACSHCNKLFVYSTEDLKAISGNGKTVMIVGDHYYIKAINVGD